MSSHLKDFVGMAREFEDLNGNSTLFAFLRMLEDAERFDSQPSVVAPVQPGMINLMTVHSSKGLQFRVVCLPHLNQGIFPSSKGQKQWPTNVTAVPDALKKDLQHPVLTSFPIRGEKLSTQLKSAFKEAYAELDDFDERRLFYVALTRSTDVVLASAAWFIDKKNGPQDPSHFLIRLHEAAELGHARVGEWWGEPQAELLAESAEDVVYPVPLNSPAMHDIRASARRVSKLLGERIQRPAASDELTKNWDAAIDFIVNEAHNQESQVVHVPMPASLSVSSALRLSENETEFIRDLLRPMPRAPQRAAARGTAFHAWAENHLRGLMGESASAVLPGMEDLDPLDVSVTDDLTKHQESFMASEWAQRPPHAVEYPFALTMGGRVLRGVIDAVYRQSDNSWLVIDWKTNARETANPLQLSLYRLAWARLQNCSEDDVRAAFFYVSTGNLVEPDSYFSLEQVAELLGETYVR
jgi:DNA helicase-2/ATP-dependent DNA helicase PcrA